MASGEKPALSIYLKPVGSKDKKDRRYVFSAWEQDGRLGALRPDRSVKAFKFQFDDGEVVTVKKGDDGKWSHYIDAFLRDGEYGGGQKAGSYDSSDRSFGGTDAPGAFADDDVSF